MRRSFAAAFGTAAILVIAACSQDQSSNRTLTPTDPLLAPGGGGGNPLCAGGLASDIAKEQKLLFLTTAGLDSMEDAFSLIKDACPIVETDPAELGVLLDYYALMIAYRTTDNAAGLAGHLFSVSRYATGTGLVRSANVFGALGGAEVLTVTASTGDALVSFDKGAQLSFAADTKTNPGLVPFGRRLFTLDPLSSVECGDVTGLRLGSRGAGAPCYDVQDYPDAAEYTPAATLTLCMHKDADENVGIVHQKSGYGDEVLPPVQLTYACGDFHMSSSNSWLEQKGPLGRALAKAYDFFAPKTLIADDVGGSGSIGSFSKVGAVLTDIFEDDFNDGAVFNLNPGADSADLADANSTWIYSAQSPGYIRIEDSFGGLTGGVLVLSQGQGACNNCPVFKLLGEIRTVDEPNTIGETDFETNGSFDVTWTSVQTKPSVKEAPFVLLNGTNGSDAAREIVRLSYVSQSSQNQLLLRIPGSGNSVTTINVGSWVQNVSQTFKITVNLDVLNPAQDKTVSLSILNPSTNEFEPVAGAQNLAAVRATSFKHIGYVLTGIDAGIIGSDDWRVTRLPDIPPQ
jgi:hypothetical protein